jgi:hypothetical protein
VTLPAVYTHCLQLAAMHYASSTTGQNWCEHLKGLPLVASADWTAIVTGPHRICREKFGDISSYLEQCGFSAEEQHDMKQLLTMSADP